MRLFLWNQSRARKKGNWKSVQLVHTEEQGHKGIHEQVPSYLTLIFTGKLEVKSLKITSRVRDFNGASPLCRWNKTQSDFYGDETCNVISVQKGIIILI